MTEKFIREMAQAEVGKVPDRIDLVETLVSFAKKVLDRHDFERFEARTRAAEENAQALKNSLNGARGGMKL